MCDMEAPLPRPFLPFIFRIQEYSEGRSSVSRTSVLEVLPSLVHFILKNLYQVFILRFEQMAESSLRSQKVLDWKLVLWHIRKLPDAVIHLKERPITSLDRKTADLHDIFCRISPSAGTGGHYIQERRTLCIDSLLRLSVQILEVSGQSSLCGIWNIVLGNDGGKVFAVLYLAG